MNKYISLTVLPIIIALLTLNLYAQNVSINVTGAVPNSSAMLDIDASPANNMGLLIPRIPLTMTTLNAPIGGGIATSLMVYNTATINDVTPGYYYWNGAAWVRFASGANNAWLLLGNAGTVDGTNFIGTTDNIPFNVRVNNQKAGRIDPTLANTFWGYMSGNANSTGMYNTAIGFQALLSNTIGSYNTAIGGNGTLRNNISGNSNTAIGVQTLLTNTTGSYNVAIGENTLYFNSTGSENTGIGLQSLNFNTTGTQNTAIGRYALYHNTSSNGNTATGYSSLYMNNTGYFNTASGKQSLYSNTTGYNNTATGYQSLNNNNTGYNNTATGLNSLYSTTSGNANTANGYYSLYANTTGGENVAVGQNALNGNTVGSNNTAIGRYSLSSNVAGSNATAVGYNAMFYSNSTAVPYTNQNVAIGYEALRGSVVAAANTGNYNTALGYQTLWSATTGFANTASGYKALYNTTTGISNTAIGYNALNYNTTGSNNTAEGMQSLWVNTTGYQNTAIGVEALLNNTTGNTNVALGYRAGYNNIIGASNVFLGYQAGFNELGSNKLYIANNSINPPLIFGDFAAGNVGLGTTSPGAKLEVNGQVKITGGTPGLGKVLTSDGVGLASWQTPSSSGITMSCGTNNYLTKRASATDVSCSQVFDNGTSVGIATTTPTAKFVVYGEAGSSEPIVTDASAVFSKNSLSASNNYLGIIAGGGSGVNGNAGIQFGSQSFPMDATIYYNNTTKFMAFRTNAAERMRIDNVGNVGIGTTTPSAKLEVNGQVKITGGTPGAGKVLTSDGVGLATWQTAPGSSVRFISGTINANGSIAAGTGFTVAHTIGTTIYTINFSVPFSGTPQVTAAPTDNSGLTWGLNGAPTTAQFGIVFNLPDHAFNFIAIGPP